MLASKNIFFRIPQFRQVLVVMTTCHYQLRDGQLELTGGGVTISPKKIPTRETCLKKNSACGDT